MRPEGGAVELLSRCAPSVPATNQGLSPTGVDEEAGVDRLGGTVGPLDVDRGSVVRRDVHVSSLGLLPDLRATSPRVLEEELIQHGAVDLVRQVRLVRDHLTEAPRGRGHTATVDEPDPGLPDEELVHLLADAEVLEEPEAEREQRLTHVVARELLLLHQED